MVGFVAQRVQRRRARKRRRGRWKWTSCCLIKHLGSDSLKDTENTESNEGGTSAEVLQLPFPLALILSNIHFFFLHLFFFSLLFFLLWKSGVILDALTDEWRWWMSPWVSAYGTLRGRASCKFMSCIEWATSQSDWTHCASESWRDRKNKEREEKIDRNAEVGEGKRREVPSTAGHPSQHVDSNTEDGLSFIRTRRPPDLPENITFFPLPWSNRQQGLRLKKQVVCCFI